MRTLHTEGVPVAPTARTGAEHVVADAWLVPMGRPTLTDEARARFRTELATLRKAREIALANREWGLAREIARREVAARRDFRA